MTCPGFCQVPLGSTWTLRVGYRNKCPEIENPWGIQGEQASGELIMERSQVIGEQRDAKRVESGEWRAVWNKHRFKTL